MIWSDRICVLFFRMYNHGHTVCGVDVAEFAVKSFFEDNAIPVEVEEVEKLGKVYKVWVYLQRDKSLITCN